jgi:hypothetical protein
MSNDPDDMEGTVALDPATYRLRNPEQSPLVWSGEKPTPDGDGESRHVGRHHFFVTGPEDTASLSFAAVDGSGDARTFLSATDYDAATVYVEQQRVRECFTYDLCYVRWTDREIDTSYARRYRDPDVACETDAYDVVATLIRIPAAIDPERIRGYSSSTGSGACEERRRRVERASDVETIARDGTRAADSGTETDGESGGGR